MKKTIYIFLFFFSSAALQAQNLEATYKVYRDIYYSTENGQKKLLATVDLMGFLYKKGETYISYCKPSYLKKYPLGNIDFQDNTGISNTVMLYKDTLQHLNYANFDSLISRTRTMSTIKKTENIFRNFSRGEFKWQILPETKIVNGLSCQKAILIVKRTNSIGYLAWFCADVPVQMNPLGIKDIPGLIVELECPTLDSRWVLTSYNTEINIADSIIWPQEFTEPFHTTKNSGVIDKKQQKRLEISNQ